MTIWRHFRVRGTAGPKWVCGHAAMGKPCQVGPNGRGRCRATFECVPARNGDQWFCRRSPSEGGPCPHGPNGDGTCSRAIPPCRPVRSPRAKRRAVSTWTTMCTFGLLILALSYAGDAKFLMPGPLAQGHASIGECTACHSGIEQGGFGWLHALVSPPSERDQSEGCLSCHKHSAEAFAPHGHPRDLLGMMTMLTRARTQNQSEPVVKQIRSALFPARKAFKDGIFCATCHKEHHGALVDLKELDSDRCHVCHEMQFASFEDGHPEFTVFPYRRRTRINFNHNSHFGEHFPKTRAKQDPTQPVQEKCADCHVQTADGRHMDVKPFDEVCSACHLHQITGAERLSSHQGISFLTLPGLDLETLEEKGASPGKWPSASGALPSPMLAMLLATDSTRARLINMISKLDLLDLSEASARELRAVQWYAWETKALLHKLASEKPAEVFAALTRTGDGRPDTAAAAQLTAHIPRDVIAGAIREWLPNLGSEIAGHTPIDPSVIAILNLSADPPAKIVLAANETQSDNDLLVEEEDLDDAGLAPDADLDAEPDFGDGAKRTAHEQPAAEEDPAVEEKRADEEKPAVEEKRADEEKPAVEEKPAIVLAANETQSDDDLLVEEEDLDDEGLAPDADLDAEPDFGDGAKRTADEQPADEEKRADEDDGKESDIVSDDDQEEVEVVEEEKEEEKEEETASQDDDEAEPDVIEGVDAQTWAESGGWYRQDFAVLYKPTGHADDFFRAWLDLTANAFSDDGMPTDTALAFAALTDEGAQGQCTKCHSIDRTANGHRKINWLPAARDTTAGGLFTRFAHQPHFAIPTDKGCMSCHQLEEASDDFKKGFEDHDPDTFASNFKAMSRAQCGECHKTAGAGTDCLTCHAYHVEGVVTPAMTTKVPRK